MGRLRPCRRDAEGAFDVTTGADGVATIDWPMPDGRSTRLRVTAVLDQPEAQGRLD